MEYTIFFLNIRMENDEQQLYATYASLQSTNYLINKKLVVYSRHIMHIIVVHSPLAILF